MWNDEDNYSYQNPPSEISNDFTKLLKSYSENITKVWYTPKKGSKEPPTLNEPLWNFRKHPFNTLANKDLHYVGDFNGKEPLCKYMIRKPKPAVPVIRDNLAKGRAVLKPFRNQRNDHVRGQHLDLGEMGYLEATKDRSTLGYGSYDYQSIAVSVSGNQKQWLPMNYNYHTDSVIPLAEHQFNKFYDSENITGTDKYKNYLQIVKQVRSRVLLKDTASCSRPKRIRTPSTNDLFGTGGLNVMSWPSMRNCALETSVDATRWKALLKEETALLKRYKALTPRGRAMAFKQALVF